MNRTLLQTKPTGFRGWYCRNIPHKTKSKNCWCLPIWWTHIFGGNFDTGNGYGWRPNLYYTIRNFLIRQ